MQLFREIICTIRNDFIYLQRKQNAKRNFKQKTKHKNKQKVIETKKLNKKLARL